MAILVKPQIKIDPLSVPDGTYKATLTNIIQFQNNYGDRIGFEFTLDDKPYSGAKIMRSTAPFLTPRSQLVKVLGGLMGRELTKDEMSAEFDIESLIGTKCSVLVMKSTSKAGQQYANIDRIFGVSPK